MCVFRRENVNEGLVNLFPLSRSFSTGTVGRRPTTISTHTHTHTHTHKEEEEEEEDDENEEAATCVVNFAVLRGAREAAAAAAVALWRPFFY